MKSSIKLVATLSLGLLAGCGEKYLDLQPVDSVTTGNFYRNESEAIQATNAVYGELCRAGQYNYALWGIGEIMSDNSTTGGGGGGDRPELVQLDNFNIPTTNFLTTSSAPGIGSGLWGGCYVGIGRANLVIARVPAITEITPIIKQRCIGEAQFLRAKYYFDLVRVYGDVPLVVNPTASLEDALIPRTPAAQVYAQIETDLQAAYTNLPPSNSGADAGRATKWAARGLLAKVYLTEGKMTEAADAARDVITNSDRRLWANYGDNFKVANENGQESLFEVQYVNGNNFDNFGFTFNGLGFAGNEFFAPRGQNLTPQGGYGINIPEPNFVNGYEAGDLRRDVTIWKPGDAYPAGSSPSVQPASMTGSPNGYNCKKWFVGRTNTNIWDSPLNFPVLRLAEVYLILAEAAPTDTEGYEALNKVRRRAFGLDMNAPSAAHDLNASNTPNRRDAVIRERRYELAFEDDRWFDLKRTGQLLTNAHLLAKGIKPFNVVMPIPQQEINVNPNLRQNDGY
jgi:hypothetical protein